MKTTDIVFFCLVWFATAAEARIEVQGHRGARAMRPENTLPAFQYALEQGVDTLEMDMAVTKDGVIVLSHEPVISPEICRDATGKAISGDIVIHALTLAQVQSYDCASAPHPRFPLQVKAAGTKIPTLEDVFALVENSPLPAAKTVHFNIETKIVPRFAGTRSPTPDEFARLFLAVVNKHKLLDRVILQSFDHRSLAAAKTLEPRLRIALLIEGTLPDVGSMVTQAKAAILSPNIDWIDKASVAAAHKAGAQVIVWTANTPEDWAYLVEIGADGIISDDPGALITWLKAKKLR